MKSLSNKNSSSEICKSLRKGEAALVGSAGLRRVVEESPSVLEVNVLNPDSGGLLVALAVVGRVNLDTVEELREASGVWLCARKEVKGFGASVFCGFAKLVPVVVKVRFVLALSTEFTVVRGLYRDVALSPGFAFSLVESCPTRNGDGVLGGGSAIFTPVLPEFQQPRLLRHAEFRDLRCLLNSVRR